MNLWLWFIVLIPSIVLHEAAHGYVANYFGDPTAKERGRLTLNPIKSIDPFGSIILPAVMLFSGAPAFGYAKPVPVNLSRLRDPRKQALWVGLAGPFVNVVLSAIGYGICEYAIHATPNAANIHIFNVGETIGLVNLLLAAFNLIPIPPLDGSAIIERFVPRKHMARYYQFRARAMPVFFVFYLVVFVFFHAGENWFYDLESWWFSLLR
jgi:Zn-dependent protease